MATKKIFSDDDEDRYWLDQAAETQFGPSPIARMTPTDFPTDVGAYRGVPIEPVDIGMGDRMGATNSQIGDILSGSDERAKQQYLNNVYSATLPMAYSTGATAVGDRSGVGANLMNANNAMYNTWNANDATKIGQINSDQQRIDQFIVNSRNVAVGDEATDYARDRDAKSDALAEEKTAYERSKKTEFGLLDGKLVYQTPDGTLVYADGSNAAQDIDEPGDIKPIKSAAATTGGQVFDFGTAMINGKQAQSRTNKSTGDVEYFMDGGWKNINAMDGQTISQYNKPNASDPIYKDGANAVVKLSQAGRSAVSASALADTIQQTAQKINDVMPPGMGTGGWNDMLENTGNVLGGSFAAPERQQLRHLISKQLPEMIASLRGMGSMSDRDLEALQAQLTSGNLQPDVINSIAAQTKYIANYNSEKYEAWKEARLDPSEYSLWESEYDQTHEYNPYIAVQAAESGASEPKSTPLEQARFPKSQEEYDALPSGTLFVDPDDGKTYRKP